MAKNGILNSRFSIAIFKCSLETPVVLSTSFLYSENIVIPIDTTKAVLSKVRLFTQPQMIQNFQIWMKIALPKSPSDTIQIAEFNSHRETLFRVLLDQTGLLQVQVHPHEGVYEAIGQSKKISSFFKKKAN